LLVAAVRPLAVPRLGFNGLEGFEVWSNSAKLEKFRPGRLDRSGMLRRPLDELNNVPACFSHLGCQAAPIATAGQIPLVFSDCGARWRSRVATLLVRPVDRMPTRPPSG